MLSSLAGESYALNNDGNSIKYNNNNTPVLLGNSLRLNDL